MWCDCSYLAGNSLAGLREKTSYKFRMARIPAEVRARYLVNAASFHVSHNVQTRNLQAA